MDVSIQMLAYANLSTIIYIIISYIKDKIIKHEYFDMNKAIPTLGIGIIIGLIFSIFPIPIEDVEDIFKYTTMVIGLDVIGDKIYKPVHNFIRNNKYIKVNKMCDTKK